MVTNSGNLIDIVDSKEEALTEMYILLENADALCDRVNELGSKTVTNAVAKILIRENLLVRRIDWL